MAKSIPAGWHSITPRLVAHDPFKMVQFLKHAFGASGDFATDRPSQIRIGDSIVMVSGAGARQATSAFLHLYVDDSDATYELALKASAVSLEQPMGEDDFSLSDLIEDREAVVPDDAAARTMLDDAVREALGHLSPREQDVVRLRFGLEDGKIRTLEEVGKAFGVTRERIRQIEAKTLAKLRRPESAQLLRDYLDEA